MIIYVLVIVAVLLASCYAIHRKRKRFQNLPNGPTGMPIIGNILQLGRKPHLTFSKWAEKFGRFYTLDLFGTPTVVINDLKTMRDLLGNPNSTGKYSTITIDAIHGPDYGVVNTEGTVWFEQHKFFTKVLRQFGFRGGNQLTSTISNECKNLCNWIDNELKDSKTGSLNLDEILLHSVANIVWNAVTGKQHTSHENKIIKLLHSVTKQFNDSAVLVFMPWLRFIAPDKTGWNQLVKISNEFHTCVQNSFDDRKVARKLGTKSKVTCNIIDAYLDQVENCEDTQSTFYGEDGMKHGVFAVVNLLLGGGETTSSNLKWLIHYLVAYPDVQRKLQAEVDAVAQEEENLEAIDKTRLPYLEAVVLEVLRISTLVPLGIMHKLLDDISYEEYILPKEHIYYPIYTMPIWTQTSGKIQKHFDPSVFLKEPKPRGND